MFAAVIIGSAACFVAYLFPCLFVLGYMLVYLCVPGYVLTYLCVPGYMPVRVLVGYLLVCWICRAFCRLVPWGVTIQVKQEL